MFSYKMQTIILVLCTFFLWVIGCHQKPNEPTANISTPTLNSGNGNSYPGPSLAYPAPVPNVASTPTLSFDDLDLLLTTPKSVDAIAKMNAQYYATVEVEELENIARIEFSLTHKPTSEDAIVVSEIDLQDAQGAATRAMRRATQEAIWLVSTPFPTHTPMPSPTPPTITPYLETTIPQMGQALRFRETKLWLISSYHSGIINDKSIHIGSGMLADFYRYGVATGGLIIEQTTYDTAGYEIKESYLQTELPLERASGALHILAQHAHYLIMATEGYSATPPKWVYFDLNTLQYVSEIPTGYGPLPQLSLPAQSLRKCNISYQVQSQWATGAVLVFTVSGMPNPERELILSFSGNQQLTNSWGAIVFDAEPGIYYIRGETWDAPNKQFGMEIYSENGDILPSAGYYHKLGDKACELNGPGTPIPTRRPTVTGTPPATPTPAPPTATPPPSPTPTQSCTVEYHLSSDWGTGFTVSPLKIINNSQTEIDGWQLQWKFANDQQITALWNGVHTHTSNGESVVNEVWNNLIPASGGIVTIGWEATYQSGNRPPTQFTLNGRNCLLRILPEPTPTPESPPNNALCVPQPLTPADHSVIPAGEEAPLSWSKCSSAEEGNYYDYQLRINLLPYDAPLNGVVDSFEISSDNFDHSLTPDQLRLYFGQLLNSAYYPHRDIGWEVRACLNGNGNSYGCGAWSQRRYFELGLERQDGCLIDYTIASDWETGFSVSPLRVTNISGSPLSEWTIEWEFDNDTQLITNLDNGVYVQIGRTVTVTNAAWNGSLPNDGFVEIGFQGSYDPRQGNSLPRKFQLNGMSCKIR